MAESEVAQIADNMSEQPAEVPQANEEAPQAAQEPKQSQQEIDYARGFNALTRKEKLLQQREQELKQKLSDYDGFNQDKTLLSTDPVKFLEKHGWKFNDLADFVLNDKKKPTESRLEELQKRIDKMEEEKKQAAEERERKQKAEEQSAKIKEYKSQIKEFINEKNEDFELINHFDEHDMVYDLIEHYYHQNNVIIEVDKAAAEVEKYLENRLELASKTNKFKSKFSQIAQGEALSESEQEAPKPRFPQVGERETPKTLSNSVVTSTAASSDKNVFLSDEESKQRSVELLKKAWEQKRNQA